MRGSRFREEQIVAILMEYEAGISALELTRRHGISRNTLYNWKKKYGGLEVSEARRLRQVEDENRRLKKIVAELTLENAAIKDALQKKMG